MGINLEFVATLVDLRREGAIREHRSVIELGAQDISADFNQVSRFLAADGLGSREIPTKTASELYRRIGYSSYTAVDTNGAEGALVFDLNKDLQKTYNFTETFDLVTNLGTLEHCFDQAAAFRNMHQLCRPGGLMIHCLPTQGLVNHAFYNYHPRFVADLAAANGYAMERIFFTEDFRPERIEYSIDSFRKRDSRDLMLYVVLRRQGATDFVVPFDGMFSASSKVAHANESTVEEIQQSEFQAYVKGDWNNIRSGKASAVARQLQALRRLFLRR